MLARHLATVNKALDDLRSGAATRRSITPPLVSLCAARFTRSLPTFSDVVVAVCVFTTPWSHSFIRVTATFARRSSVVQCFPSNENVNAAVYCAVYLLYRLIAVLIF